MTTEKQTKANQQNALESTGPKTPEGKAMVSRNAIRHGIFAREAVIQTGDGRESGDEYAELLAGLREDLKPQGQMEQLVVEKIAVNYWRLRRLVRYETGEVREMLDEFMTKAIDDFYSSDSIFSSKPSRPEMYYYDFGDTVTDAEVVAQETSVAQINDCNRPLEETDAALEFVFRWKLNPDRELDNLPDGWREKTREHLISLTPQQKGKIRREVKEREEQILAEMKEVRSWKLRFDRLARLRAIPRGNDLEKVIKYETALERSIFRNLDTLKRLQEGRGASA